MSPEGFHGDAHGARVASAWRSAADADLLLFLVDAQRQSAAPDPRISALLARAAASLRAAAPERPAPPPALLLLSKADLLPGGERGERLLASLVAALSPLHAFDAAFAVSALRNQGVRSLAAALAARAQPRPWPLAAEAASDAGRAAQALMATREALFERIHAEVPYGVALRHVSWTEFRDGSVRIEQELRVPSDAQRRIVVGRAGAAVGQLGIAARKALERQLGRRVHLVLRVRVARTRGGRAARAAGDGAAAADAQRWVSSEE